MTTLNPIAERAEGRAPTKSNLPLVTVALAVAVLLATGVLALLLFRPTASNAYHAKLSADVVYPAGTKPAPAFNLANQDQQATSLSALHGQVLAIVFLDSHCQQLCPLLAGQVGAAVRDLKEPSGFKVVVVSVAPSTDTPASERAFATKFGWASNWLWLKANQSTMANVWREYGIYVAGDSPTLSHTIGLFLVDKHGYERAIFMASANPTTLETDISGLRRES